MWEMATFYPKLKGSININGGLAFFGGDFAQAFLFDALIVNGGMDTLDCLAMNPRSVRRDCRRQGPRCCAINSQSHLLAGTLRRSPS
jgi:hypothetical protein